MQLDMDMSNVYEIITECLSYILKLSHHKFK